MVREGYVGVTGRVQPTPGGQHVTFESYSVRVVPLAVAQGREVVQRQQDVRMIGGQAALANGERGTQRRICPRIVVRTVLHSIAQMVQVFRQSELGSRPGSSVNGDSLTQQRFRTKAISAVAYSAGQIAQRDGHRSIGGAEPLAPDLECFGQNRLRLDERGFVVQDGPKRMQLARYLEAPRSAFMAGNHEGAAYQTVRLIEQPEL